MPRVYYGWYVVAAAIVAFMLVLGITNSTFGIFVIPVSQEFGISRGDMNTAMIFMMIGCGVCAPAIGWLLDRLPIRLILVVSALLLSGAIVGLGLSRSLALSSFLILGPISAGTLGAASISLNVLIARWFVHQRGRAMALGQLGMSLGGLVVAPVVGVLVVSYGWRLALVYSGIAIGAVLVTIFLRVRTEPGPGDVETTKAPIAAAEPAAQAEEAGPGVTLRDIVKTPAFWTIVVGSSLVLAVCQAILATITPLAIDAGYSNAQATGLLAFLGVGATASALLVAAIADRVDRSALLAVLMIGFAIINAIPIFTTNYSVLVIIAMASGFGAMATAPLMYALLADLFGARAFGSVQGLMSPVMTGIIAVGVRMAGEIYDYTGSYALMFPIFVGVELVAAALVFSTRFFASRGDTKPAAAPEAAILAEG